MWGFFLKQSDAVERHANLPLLPNQETTIINKLKV
jgi:hypothetical protein